MIAFVFPGQGSQKIGMCKDTVQSSISARQIMDRISQAVSIDIESIMMNGPQEILNNTQYAQLAVFTSSMIFLDHFQKETKLTPNFALGHSVGEYSALCACNVLDIETTARLLKGRGLLMSQAKDGCMIAVIGKVDTEILENDISKFGFVIANYNSDQQVVISGPISNLMHIEEYLQHKKYIKLAVSGAFHSHLMNDAAQSFADLLQPINFEDPSYSFVSSVSGDCVTIGSDIKTLMIKQITSPVKWHNAISYAITQGANQIIEFGANVLTNMAKRTFVGIETTSIL